MVAPTPSAPSSGLHGYLDYNATAPMKPAVKAAVLKAMDVTGNPSSVHRHGRDARRLVEEARERVAALVGATPAQVIFTGGGTEANNLALAVGAGRVLATSIEHESVRALVSPECLVPVDGDGVIDLAALERLIEQHKPAMVATMLVNNETGVIQPVADAAALAHRRAVHLHCDAVQAAGRLHLDMAGLGADTLSLSAHKLGGPQGVGALVVRAGLAVQPLIRGGGQERRQRAGTETVAGLVGFGVAAQESFADLAGVARLSGLRDRLEDGVRAANPEAVVFGRAGTRVCNTSCIATPGLASDLQVMAFDLAGVSVSAGAACSSGKVAASHVLTAMGAGPLAGCAIRASLGWASAEADVAAFLSAYRSLVARKRPRRAAA